MALRPPMRISRLYLHITKNTSKHFIKTSVSRPPFASFFFPNNSWPMSALLPISGKEATLADALKQPNLPESTQYQYPPAQPPSMYKPILPLTLRSTLKIYGQLSKVRLTTLVVLTAMSGVALSPLPTTVPILLSTALGTTLCAASANSLNQLSEVPFDAQMARTRSRPLVRRAITPLHAAGFATVTGIVGPTILWTFVNPTTAILGAANIVLYAGIYTALKRRSVVNTWIGAIVGGIPPLMGWTACGGGLWPTAHYSIELFPPPFLADSAPVAILSDNPLSALALFLLHFSWQFPHFNSLSYLVRDSYAQGGYHMLSVVSPARNAAVALRHTLLFIPICSILTPLAGITTWTFALTSMVPNAFLCRNAWRFWKRGDEKSAKVLFRNALWYLPVILGLMMFHKQGLEWTAWLGSLKDENTFSETLMSNEQAQ